MNTAYLAMCATCGAYPAAAMYATDVPQPRPFYCPRCRAGLIPADDLAQVDAAVGLVDAAPEAQWVVLSRDGDLVTIRPLGLPNFPARTVTVAEIRPKFSYQRLAQARKR
jgi:hypothetical protein